MRCSCGSYDTIEISEMGSRDRMWLCENCSNVTTSSGRTMPGPNDHRAGALHARRAQVKTHLPPTPMEQALNPPREVVIADLCDLLDELGE